MTIKALLFLILATVASANFVGLNFQPKTPEVSNICIFSKDETKFPPKCFLCRNSIYPTVLQTCLNGTTTMPKNVSYAQANCMSSNCGINYPTAPPPMKMDFLKSIGDLFKMKGKRSISEDQMENSVLDPLTSLEQVIPDELEGVKVKIVLRAQTFASDLDEDEGLKYLDEFEEN